MTGKLSSGACEKPEFRKLRFILWYSKIVIVFVCMWVWNIVIICYGYGQKDIAVYFFALNFNILKGRVDL